MWFPMCIKVRRDTIILGTEKCEVSCLHTEHMMKSIDSLKGLKSYKTANSL